MEAYQTEFESVSIKSLGLSKAWLVSFFITRLKRHLRCALLLARPTTYYEAVLLAKLHEMMHDEV